MNPAKRLSRFNVTSLALGLAFLYLPIVILVIYSFNASRLVTVWGCLLYTSPSPRDRTRSRMPSSA